MCILRVGPSPNACSALMFTVLGQRGTMSSFTEPGDGSRFPPPGTQVLLSGKSL